MILIRLKTWRKSTPCLSPINSEFKRLVLFFELVSYKIGSSLTHDVLTVHVYSSYIPLLPLTNFPFSLGASKLWRTWDMCNSWRTWAECTACCSPYKRGKLRFSMHGWMNE